MIANSEGETLKEERRKIKTIQVKCIIDLNQKFIQISFHRSLRVHCKGIVVSLAAALLPAATDLRNIARERNRKVKIKF